ncbi:alginate export family protein [Lutibacter sp.]|uniref:alginate export family protein n=1 Tax=Lutibacter sp. TaxID=1925666 RepID=UPI003565A3A4
MKFKNLLIAILVLVTMQSYAQLTISGELRPRAEYRNGYKTLTADGSDAALFVSQRTRLNTKYVTDDYTFFLSFQDVRVWGDVAQLNTADNNGLAVHEAWGQVKFNPSFSVKLGRQEIIYDDSRMFGNVGWAQQGRSHDAAIFKFGNENYKLDLGVAYNQDAEALFGNLYTVGGNYKAMQYAWFHKDWSNIKASFLLLNNGLQNVAAEEIRYSQTLGTNLNFKASSNLNVAVNAYLQSGKDVADRDLSAYLVGLDLGYKASDKVNLGLGFEIQSGNAYDGEVSKNKAFTPFYGTNHKFNGFMDYFYVGNHANSVGLVDIYAKIGTKLGEKSSLTAFVHNFSAQADIAQDVEKHLGTEIDLVYSHKLNNDVTIGAGYSQMFASEGLEVLKNNASGNGNNWAWLMLTIKPTLFSSK